MLKICLFPLLSKPIETPCVWIIEGYIFRLRRHNPTKKTNMCFWYIVLSGWIISLWISFLHLRFQSQKIKESLILKAYCFAYTFIIHIHQKFRMHKVFFLVGRIHILVYHKITKLLLTIFIHSDQHVRPGDS